MGLHVITGGRTSADDARDVQLVVCEHIVPAANELRRLAEEGDLEGVRVVSGELIAALGAVFAACPRPRVD